MTYPLFVVAVAVVVLIIVMAKVIPTLADVFTDLGGTLPLMTRMLIAIFPFLREWWLLMLAVLAWSLSVVDVAIVLGPVTRRRWPCWPGSG
mgnify:CR=1 FL=1